MSIVTRQQLSTNLKKDSKQVSLWNLIQDAWKLVSVYKDVMNTAPLQLYCSGLTFAPEQSMIRKSSQHLVPPWICELPKVQDRWDRTSYTLEGHSEAVRALAFSPVSSLLASGSSDLSVKLWSTESGTMLHTLEGHSRPVRAVAFSPIDTTLASASADKTIKLWDTSLGLLRQTWVGHSDEIVGIEYSPEGDRLVSCSDDKTIKLWDTNTGIVLNTLHGHPMEVTALTYLAHGTRFASSCEAGLINIWDPITGSLQYTTQSSSSSLASLVVSPDSKFLAALNSYNTEVLVYSTNAGVLNHHLVIQPEWPSAIAFSPDSKRIICGEISSRITIWDVTTGVLQDVLYGHTRRISAIERSSRGMDIASGSADGMIKLWNIFVAPGDHPPTEKREYGESDTEVCFSPDGKQVASAAFLGSPTILLWDASMHDTGALQRVLRAPSNLILAIAFSANGHYFAAGSTHGLFSLWDLAHRGEEPTLVFHFDTENDTRETRELSIANDTIWRNDYDILRISFLPDGSHVIVILANHTLNLLRIEKEAIEPLWTFRYHQYQYTSAVAFSQDSRQIACESWGNGNVTILDAMSGGELQSLQAHEVFNLPRGEARLKFQHGVMYWEMEAETKPGRVKKRAKIPFVDYKLWSNSALHWEDAQIVTVEGQWIVRTHDGKKLLWLPPSYRATNWDYHDGKLALAHPFGRVTILSLDLSRIETGRVSEI